MTCIRCPSSSEFKYPVYISIRAVNSRQARNRSKIRLQVPIQPLVLVASDQLHAIPKRTQGDDPLKIPATAVPFGRACHSIVVPWSLPPQLLCTAHGIPSAHRFRRLCQKHDQTRKPTAVTPRRRTFSQFTPPDAPDPQNPANWHPHHTSHVCDRCPDRTGDHRQYAHEARDQGTQERAIAVCLVGDARSPQNCPRGLYREKDKGKEEDLDCAQSEC